jgi:hypothetical protein
MKKNKAKSRKPAKRPAPVAITLRVYPHVIQTDRNGVEDIPARLVHPNPGTVERLAAAHRAKRRTVTVQHFNAQGLPIK